METKNAWISELVQDAHEVRFNFFKDRFSKKVFNTKENAEIFASKLADRMGNPELFKIEILPVEVFFFDGINDDGQIRFEQSSNPNIEDMMTISMKNPADESIIPNEEHSDFE